MVPLLMLVMAGCGGKPAETAIKSPTAAGPKIEIISPADGTRLDAKAENKLDYNITPGSDSDHAHVYVDNRRVTMLHQNKGSYTFDYLEPGKRDICVTLVDQGHSQIGVERCMAVMVE